MKRTSVLLYAVGVATAVFAVVYFGADFARATPGACCSQTLTYSGSCTASQTCPGCYSGVQVEFVYSDGTDTDLKYCAGDWGQICNGPYSVVCLEKSVCNYVFGWSNKVCDSGDWQCHYAYDFTCMKLYNTTKTWEYRDEERCGS
jgi:hypothetical protein